MVNQTVHDKTIVPYDESAAGGIQKKGKLGEEQDVKQDDLEATGPGAASNLTGPYVAPRQEQ